MNKENESKAVVSSEDLQRYVDLYNSTKKISKRYLSCPIEVLEKCSPRACILYMQILYKSNLTDRMSNKKLADAMGCTTRNLENIIKELVDKKCITVFYNSRTERYIYPNYILPFVLTSRRDRQEQDDSNELEIGNADGWKEL